MNFPVTLTGASLSFDLQSSLDRRLALEVYNEGPDTVYYGNVPAGDLTVSPYNYPATANNNAFLEGGAVARLRQGMVLTGGTALAAYPAGTYIERIDGNIATLSEDATGSDDVATAIFSAPAIDEDTGIPILAGETKMFTAAAGNLMNNRALRFIAASGATATLRFRCSE